MRRYNKTTTKKAFTLIEFMLAMSFLAVLLVAIATLSMRIMQIYQKGLALRAVNDSGKSIISDMTTSIAGSAINSNINPTTISAYGAQSNISIESIFAKRTEYYKTFYADTASTEPKEQLSGIFCTDSYAYVWNTAPMIRTLRKDKIDTIYANNINGYFNGESGNYRAIPVTVRSGGGARRLTFPKFAKIKNKYNFCETNSELSESVSTPKFPYSTGSNSGLLNKKQIETIDPSRSGDSGIVVDEEDYADLISNESDDTDLAIYDLVVQPAYQSTVTNHILYNISFIIGTVNGGININSSGDYCTGEKDDGNNNVDEFTMNGFEYCALNKFDFTAIQTGQAQ